MLSQIQLNENAKSSAVKETDQINTQITAPGALTALAFIYLKSNNSSIATRIDLPRTFTALDNVTPQILVLRVIARNLIMWDSIENTKGWITSQIPDFIRLVFESTNQASLTKELRYRIDEKEIDFASISQSFANIIAASVLSMGFKFAGTSDRTAKQTVLSEIAWFRKKV
jgi:anaphase-promoting complex subunit 1